MKRFVLVFTALFAALTLNAAPIVLRVDATGVASNVYHAHLTIPAAPGPLTLFYPKWIPGEHGPTGPINGLTGLQFAANGKSVPWQRDPVEMFAFQIDVPAGATALEVDLDFLAPAPGAKFTAGASTSPRLGVLSWNTVLLYPRTAGGSDALLVEATLRIPSGWQYATALETRGRNGDEIQFETASLTTLVDSPVQLGTILRKIDIPNKTGLRHTLNLLSESTEATQTPDDFAAQYGRLVDETSALFGANHYRHYDWLFTLSDAVAHFGLEHHESSDDRVVENRLREDPSRKWVSTLLAHEFVHSWNGKYRRPAGLATGNYEKPMTGELLWVYEGLTQYLGDLLPVRSGILSADDYRENLAETVAQMNQHVGRTWRPLLDTAVAAQLLYDAPGASTNWRRSVDYYPEGELLWLDVDMTIRSLTNGKRSLDDFCRAFYGGASGHPELKPYTFDDIVAALNAVAPNDWRTFLNQRLTSTAATAPVGGIEQAGWRLVYNDKPNTALQFNEGRAKGADLSASLGFTVQDNSSIGDVVPNSIAAKAGLTPGAHIIAVNGRAFSTARLRDVVKGSMSATTPMEIIVQNGEFFTTASIDYRGGERYPHLERVTGKADSMEALVKPLVPPPAAPPKKK
ncbi:MAG: PDZ domain-containing protein [Acidobacteriota bacterium]|nr:PDZ domain-containing protein [Acidobacteriota bacterium]